MLSILFNDIVKSSTTEAVFKLYIFLPWWELLYMKKLTLILFLSLTRRHLETGFLCLVRLNLNNQLKIMTLTLVVRLSKVLYRHRKQLLNSFCVILPRVFYWFCSNLIPCLTNFQYFLNTTLLLVSFCSLSADH